MFSFSQTRVLQRIGLAQLAKFCARGAWRLLHWPAKVMQARRDMALLTRMDAHELADIGLSRTDIANASALSLDADPTTFLAHAARTRRHPNRTHPCAH